MKPHDPSIQSSRSTDPLLEGTVSSSGASGPEDLDSGKATSHISLGKFVLNY